MTRTRPSRRLAVAARSIGWALVALACGAWGVAGDDRDRGLDGVDARLDLVYPSADGRSGRLDLYRPAGEPPPRGWPVVVAIHGGGWCGGSKGPYGRELAARLVPHGIAVASIDYALAGPRRPGWPSSFEDAAASLAWLRSRSRDFGLDPTRVAALGASAGGHLAAMLGTAADGPARADAAIAFYGPADLTRPFGIGADWPGGGPVGQFLGGRPEERPESARDASPVEHVDEGDSPVLLIHGEADRVVPLDQSLRLADRLDRAGVPHRLIVVEGAGHGFGLEGRGRDLLPDVLAFLDASWNHEVTGPPRPVPVRGQPADLSIAP